jgi:hypothetical protein
MLVVQKAAPSADLTVLQKADY